MSTTDSTVKDLGARIVKASETTDNKIKMLMWLKESRPAIYIEAQLSNDTLFLGFEPDPSVHLAHLITDSIICTPRFILPDTKTTERYIEVLRRLKKATTDRLHALVRYKSPWMRESELGEIVWYDLFSDKVSLWFSNDDGYKVVKRTELFQNGLAETRHTNLLDSYQSTS